MTDDHLDAARPLVFLGGATTDTVVAVPHHPGPDERVIATATVRAGGGPAATAAVTAARMGAVGVLFVGAVGDDAHGEALLADLDAEGVDVSCVTRAAGAATGSSVVVVDTSRGTRSICATLGPRVTLEASTATGRRALEAVRAARWVHVDHLGWSALTSALDVGAGPDARPPVSADVSYAVPGFSPRGVDLYAPSLDDDEDDAAVEAFLRDALERGAAVVVATRGARGATAATADGLRVSVGGTPVPVVSTLGAGDVFHGALLAALDRGLDLEGATACASAVAAASCRGLDGRSAVPRVPSGLEAEALLAATLAAPLEPLAPPADRAPAGA